MAASTFAVSAAETKTIHENMDSIQQQLLAEEISLNQYTQAPRSLNRVLESKKLHEIKATVTYDQALSVEEAYRITQNNGAQLEALEMRFYQQDEPYTVFLRNIGEEETSQQVLRIMQEQNLDFSGVIAANVTLSSEHLAIMEADKAVYCVDASADDYLEDRNGTQAEQKEGFRKSLAWELGN